MQKKRLRAAVIGLGVGERHIEGYESTNQCQVTILCDLNTAKLKEIGSRYPDKYLTNNPETVLTHPDIDVVSIASYDNCHHDQILIALEYGKHIFVEKPLCLTQAEFDSLAQAKSKYPHLQISSNLILRKTSRFINLRSKIQSGEMGQLYYLEGDYDYGRLHKLIQGWRGKIPKYSVVHGGAIHLIDLLLWLTGEEVDEVFAYGNNLSSQSAGYKNNDLVAALLQFKNGMTAKVTANFASVAPHHHKLCVYGSHQTFEQSHQGAIYINSRDPTDKPFKLDDQYPGTAKGDMLPEFVASILYNKQPEVTTQEVFDVMAVSLAIEESIQRHCPITVDYANI